MPGLVHIYRNTPFGRETLLTSASFCRALGLPLNVYVPTERRFLLYFEHNAVQVSLDGSYLTDPESARARAAAIATSMLPPASVTFFEPGEYSASNLPDLPTDFTFMTCPRVLTEPSSKIALGKIGSGVRSILKAATFPVLLPAAVFKPWEHVVALFGGSRIGVDAVKLALAVSRVSGKPLGLLTVGKEGERREYYEAILAEAGILDRLKRSMGEAMPGWRFAAGSDFAAELFHVPHDALVVLGAYGHGMIQDLFGSRMELVQSVLPNPLLVAGPGCTVTAPGHFADPEQDLGLPEPKRLGEG